VFTLLAISSANAQELRSSSGDWEVLISGKAGKKLCYALSRPVVQDGHEKPPQKIYAMIATRDGKTIEISFSSASKFKSGSEAIMIVDGQPYRMFTRDEMAWTFTESQDRKALVEMTNGKALAIQGADAEGGIIDYGYSLSGFDVALSSVKKLCH